MAVVVGLASCDKKTGQLETTPTGLKYMFHKGDTTGKKANVGDIISLQMIVRNHKDSIIGRIPQPPDTVLQIPLRAPTYKGSLEEGFALLSAGDSVTFFVNVDSMAKQMGGQPLPVFLKTGTDIKYSIRVDKIQTQDEAKKELEGLAGKQKALDAKLIADYIAKNNLTNVQNTPSGLNYIITQPGTGKQALTSSVVSVKYTGKLLDGSIFDSSDKHGGTPVEFPLNQVIPGWTEGIALLKEGSKATLIIPSGMAYGQQAGPVPKNSVLVFDVELVQVKEAPTQQAAPGPGGM